MPTTPSTQTTKALGEKHPLSKGDLDFNLTSLLLLLQACQSGGGGRKDETLLPQLLPPQTGSLTWQNRELNPQSTVSFEKFNYPRT